MNRKPNNYWKHWKNVELELVEIIKNINHFPTSNELKKLNKSSLVRTIVEYHGGFSNVRKKMGYNNGREKPGHWTNQDNIYTELNSLISEINKFPLTKDFKINKKEKLLMAIGRYHGGLSKIKNHLGYNEGNKPHGYWKNKMNIETELKSVIKNIGKFPNTTDLKKLGLGSMNTAISKYHQGINEFDYLNGNI